MSKPITADQVVEWLGMKPDVEAGQASGHQVLETLAEILREKLTRGDTVIPALQKVMDDLLPGWRNEAHA